jgi:hypothetical protein
MRTAASVLALPCPALLFCIFFGQPARAGLFGIIASDEINTQLPTTSFGGGGSFVDAPGGVTVALTAFGLDPLSHGDSVTGFDSNVNGLVTVFASASVLNVSAFGPALHDWVTTSGGTGDPSLPGNGDAIGNVEWFDTLYVSGPPIGTPVLLTLTYSLDGSLLLSGDSTGSQITYNVALTQPGGYGCGTGLISGAYTTTTLIDSVQYANVCTFSGATLSFAEAIQADVYGATDWSATANLNSTSNAYIDSLTPGVTISSASGLVYSTPSSAVPEPSYELLVGAALLVFVSLGRRARILGRTEG